MASISTDSNGRRRIQFIDGNGKRKAIRLGKMPMKLANEVKLKVETMDAANRAGFPLDTETARWVATKLSDDLAAKFAAVGLMPRRISAKLGAFIDSYISCRTDVKPATLIGLEQTKARLLAF